MRVFATVITIVALAWLIALIATEVSGSYEYSQKIESFWSLSEKASTVDQKSTYMDQFVTALDESGLKGTNNAVFFTTPDNSFDKNMEALKSLQLRFHEIKGMDITSMAYQTAIQQITQQEQAEAKEMLNVFEGCWWKAHHPLVWNWWGAINLICWFLCAIIAGVCIKLAIDEY